MQKIQYTCDGKILQAGCQTDPSDRSAGLIMTIKVCPNGNDHFHRIYPGNNAKGGVSMFNAKIYQTITEELNYAPVK
jgi:hypothetical protein